MSYCDKQDKVCDNSRWTEECTCWSSLFSFLFLFLPLFFSFFEKFKAQLYHDEALTSSGILGMVVLKVIIRKTKSMSSEGSTNSMFGVKDPWPLIIKHDIVESVQER